MIYNLTALSIFDAYKIGHIAQMPNGVGFISSNFTPRFDKYFPAKDSKFYDGKVVVAGTRSLAHFLHVIFKETFFNVPLVQVLEEFVDLVEPFVTGEVNTKHIVALHNLGYLPIEIKALPEGSVVNTGVATITIMNTVEGFGWLVGMLEDAISNESWKVCTNATIARVYRKMLEAYAEISGVDKAFVDVQGHDFSLRGLGGMGDGAVSGQGHLMYFIGTDNIPAANHTRKLYGDKFVGCSVSATEHLVSSMNILTQGIDDKELAEGWFFERYITEVYPNGVCSYVADTYDYWGFISKILPKFKNQILARGYDKNNLSKVVIRPDSGNPVNVVAGFYVTTKEVLDCEVYGYNCLNLVPDFTPEVVEIDGKYFMIEYTTDFYGNVDWECGQEISREEAIGSVEVLIEIFGSTVNEKGFRVLCDRVGLIYGDSITPSICEEILERLVEKRIATNAVVFGIGSYTYNYSTRDSQGWAMKGTWCRVNGYDFAIYKDPKTSSSKKSARGLLSVVKDEQGNYIQMQNRTLEQYAMDTELVPFFRNSKILGTEPFAAVRNRALNNL